MAYKQVKQLSRYGWHEHYVERYTKTGERDACHLVIWYLFLHLARV